MAPRFGLLGPMQVEGPAGPIDAGSPKQRAVLALLLIDANRPVTPDRLVEELWGDRPPPSALATLQAYISNLRRALEPDRPARSPATVLVTNGGGYQLNTGADHLDTLRFAALVTEAADQAESAPGRARDLLVDALGLWRGPALADFRYEEFAQAEIARLDELRVMALEQRVAADLALGRAEELVPELEALLGDHPLRERLWGHLMVALYRAGRQAEALRAYRRCEERLGEELGIVPGPALRDLELAILNQDPALDPPPRPAEAQQATSGAGSLVGRAAERQAFRQVLTRAAEGRGGVVIVEGEAGIGKTRLLETLEEDAAAGGFRTAFARCVEIGGAPPFWPWIQLVRQLGLDAVTAAAGEYSRHLAPLLPPGGAEPAAPGPPLFHLIQGVTAALAGLASERPVLLVVDDLYSADPDSLALLTLVAAELDGMPVAMLVSHRGVELGPEHPLSAALDQLMRFDWVLRLPLARFQLGEVRELVGRMVGGHLEEDTIRAIHDRTEGNAFFTIELARLLEADPDAAARGVPATVVEVLARRLDRLSPGALRLVRAGAVYGREFELGLVAGAIGADFEAAVGALEEALRLGLLAEAGTPGVFRFSHMIVVNSVTHALGALRRAYIHGQIAEMLERRHGHDPQRAVEIAHHRVAAVPVAGAGPAVEALARAGDHAMQATALAQAADLFDQRHALVLSEPPSPDRDRMELASLYDVGRLWTWREGYHSARVGEAAWRMWELTGIGSGAIEFDPGEPITATNPVLSALQARFSYEIVVGDVNAAAEVTARLADLKERYPDPMVVLSWSVAALVTAVHTGDVAAALEALAAGGAATEVLDPSGTDLLILPMGQQSGRVSHRAFGGWAHWLAGDRERAMAELAQARELCDRFGHPFTRAFNMVAEGMVAAMDHNPEWVARTLAWGASADDDGQFGLFDVWRGLLGAWAAGHGDVDPAEAAARMRVSLASLESAGAEVVHSLYWSMVADLELEAGAADRALEATGRGIGRADRSGERYWVGELLRQRSEALRLLGRPDEAEAARRSAASEARRMGHLLLLERVAVLAAT